MNLQLQSDAAISAAIASADYPTVTLIRRQQLANQMISASHELDQTVTFLLSQAASTDEANFLRALVGASPSSDGASAPVTNVATGGFAPAVASVGDGADGSLETMLTASLTVPILRTIVLAGTGEEQDWVLLAGADANDALHQRPVDFDATHNAKVWVRKR